MPIRDILHPDGPLNYLAHTPANAVQPDVGPRGTNSWAVDAATGTTLLRSQSLPNRSASSLCTDAACFCFASADMTDIANLMYWGHHDEATGRELRIRWDVFKAEDVDKVSSLFSACHARAEPDQNFLSDLVHSFEISAGKKCSRRGFREGPRPRNSAKPTTTPSSALASTSTNDNASCSRRRKESPRSRSTSIRANSFSSRLAVPTKSAVGRTTSVSRRSSSRDPVSPTPSKVSRVRFQEGDLVDRADWTLCSQ